MGDPRTEKALEAWMSTNSKPWMVKKPNPYFKEQRFGSTFEELSRRSVNTLHDPIINALQARLSDEWTLPHNRTRYYELLGRRVGQIMDTPSESYEQNLRLWFSD